MTPMIDTTVKKLATIASRRVRLAWRSEMVRCASSCSIRPANRSAALAISPRSGIAALHNRTTQRLDRLIGSLLQPVRELRQLGSQLPDLPQLLLQGSLVL